MPPHGGFMTSETLILLMAVVVPILSSVVTLVLVFLVYKLWLHKILEAEYDRRMVEAEQDFRRELEQAAEEMLPEFRAELVKGFEEAAEELLPEFRAEVVKGFEEAAEELLPEFRREVAAGFEESAQALLPEFREHVKQGLLEGAEEVLPEFREQVKAGFEDAILAAAGGKFVDRTAQSVAKSVETGLNILFGKPRMPRSPRDD